MSSLHPLKRGVIAVSAAFSLLGAAAPSQAAIVGSFDPPFGGSNPDLANVGFRGTFDLNASAGCYGQANAYVFTGNGCSITVNSITVNFYNLVDNPTGNPANFVASYTLDSSTGTFAVPTEQDYITGAYFGANDRLVGFDTADSNAFNVNINQCPFGSGSCNSNSPIVYNGNMLLYFVSGFQPQVAVQGEPSSVSGFGDPAYLVDCNTSTTEVQGACSRYTNENSNGATVTVTSDPGPLPEPETIPLTLIGLAALTVGRWRRRTGSIEHSRPAA